MKRQDKTDENRDATERRWTRYEEPDPGTNRFRIGRRTYLKGMATAAAAGGLAHTASAATGPGVLEDFERADPLADYGGSTGLFNVETSSVYEGSQALTNASGSFGGINSTSGLNQYPERGDEVHVFFNNASDDNFVAFNLFSQSASDNPDRYSIGLSGTDGEFKIWKTEGGSISSLSGTPPTQQISGWYRSEVWTDSTTIHAELYDDANDTLLAAVQADDTTFSSGGIGFRSAGNGEIWDYAFRNVVEDFERADPLADYDGATNLFNVETSTVYEGSQALINDGGNFGSAVSTTGLTTYPERGDEVHVHFTNAADDNFVAFHLFAQSETNNPDSYSVGISSTGAWKLWVNEGGTTTEIASADLPASEQIDGWYRAEVRSDDTSIYADLYDDASDALLASVQADDTTWSSGGIGFRSAGNGEVWDFVVRRRDSGSDLSHLDLVDAHLHIVPRGAFERDPLDVDQLVSWMDDNGIDRGVVLPLESPEAYPVTVPNWWVVEECAGYPDRLIPFFTVDPRTEVYGSNALDDLFQRNVNEGAKGFGEFKPGLDIDDSRMVAIFDRCALHGLPILFHSDDKACTDDLDFTQLENVLASYPEVDFLGHGQGWWARISGDVTEADLGGYPDGPVEPGGAVPRLLTDYDNIYGELSGRSGWNALTRDMEFGQTFLETHSSQLIFGTDYLYPGQNVQNFGMFDEFELDDEAWSDIRFRNLESVLLA